VTILKGPQPPPQVKNVNKAFLANDIKDDAYNSLHSELQSNLALFKDLSQSCSTSFLQSLDDHLIQANWSALQRQLRLTFEAYHKLEPLLWEADFENSERNRLRDRIYSWPYGLKTCAIDNDVRKFADADTYYEVSNLNSQRGLDAIEHLLFSPLQHACLDDFELEELGVDRAEMDQWNDLSESEKMRQRCELSLRLTQAVSEDIELERQLFDARLQGESEEKILQLFYESLVIFVDRKLKDRKIGTPSGSHEESCTETSCPLLGEHRLSQLGVEALIWNYEGLLQTYTASERPNRGQTTDGFHGLLHTQNLGALANQIFDLLR
jgi:hypothetical protein